MSVIEWPFAAEWPSVQGGGSVDGTPPTWCDVLGCIADQLERPPWDVNLMRVMAINGWSVSVLVRAGKKDTVFKAN